MWKTEITPARFSRHLQHNNYAFEWHLWSISNYALFRKRHLLFMIKSFPTYNHKSLHRGIALCRYIRFPRLISTWILHGNGRQLDVICNNATASIVSNKRRWPTRNFQQGPILLAWIDCNVNQIMRDDIAYLFPNFHGHWSLGMDK